MAHEPDMSCPIARSLSVLGERWTLLIIREAVFGSTRFSEFRSELGIAPDVLSDRLATLVEHGVMERVSYRDPGSRAREAYELTDAGRELGLILGALRQWGLDHMPRPEDPTITLRAASTERLLHVGYVDDGGHEVTRDDVTMIRAAA
jgi:DNA-binding HxlR family transcriptional regulator